MSQQNLNLGTGNDTGDGDTLRVAMAKIQGNTTVLYSHIHNSESTSPTVNDDSTAYEEGTVWIRRDTDEAWILIDNLVGAAVWRTVANITDTGIVLPKESGAGLKIDRDAPTYPWRDIIGTIIAKTSGPGTPTFSTFRDNINGWIFGNNDVIDMVYHLPHDYAPGTDIHLHVHWSHNGTNISGSVEFTNYVTYAKGHQQATFPAEVTNIITRSALNITNAPRYSHNITENQVSISGGSVAHIDTDDIEPDGVILVRLKTTGVPTVTGGNLFIQTIDIHYQSTNIGTKDKAPNFYT